MQSPSAGGRGRKRLPASDPLRKEMSLFHSPLPSECPPPSWKCWFSLRTQSMSLDKEFYFLKRDSSNFWIHVCEQFFLFQQLLRDLQCLYFFAPLFLLYFGELSYVVHPQRLYILSSGFVILKSWPTFPTVLSTLFLSSLLHCPGIISL